MKSSSLQFVTAVIATLFDAAILLSPMPACAGNIPAPPDRPCDPGITVSNSLVHDEWMRLGGPNGPMGCPKANFVKDASNGGGFYPFENGQIAISPDVWQQGVVAAYQDDGRTAGCAGCIFVDWNVSLTGSPQFNYDYFMVRWDFKAQQDSSFSHFDGPDVPIDPFCGGNFKGQGEQCEVMDHRRGSHDSHLRTKGSFALTPDRVCVVDGRAEKCSGEYRITIEGCDSHITGSKCPQGWMHPVTVEHQEPQSPDTIVDMRDVPSAYDVRSSKAAWSQRAAAITLYNACRLLPYSAFHYEEDYRTIILAKLAYAEYYQQDRCPGRTVNNRDEAFASLLEQRVESKTGTTSESLPYRTGEYDVALSGFIAVAYRYRNVLPPNVYDHLVNVLLNKSGGLKYSDIFAFPLTPESENHLNMIESARYLTNDLLYARTHDSHYDNKKNGLQKWWLKRLKNFLKTDFIEYNARPYQGYTAAALQNLYSYASDHAVKTAAGMVLDYISAKLAVSSSDNRRAVPYRRKKEFNEPFLLGRHADPQSMRMIALAGDLEIWTSWGR